jgi:hypothetical protein
LGIASTTDDNLALYYNGGARGYFSTAVGNSQLNFTGQHRCISKTINDISNKIGYIVRSNGVYQNIQTDDNNRPDINESLPIIDLSNNVNDKAVFGVISNAEDSNSSQRVYELGIFVSVYPKEENDNRIIVNSVGEGAIWVCNANGNVENGDYITTCQIPGLGSKQNDDLLHNYTVAKATCSVDFNNLNTVEETYEVRYLEENGNIITKEEYNVKLQSNENVYVAAFIGCTYHCG